MNLRIAGISIGIASLCIINGYLPAMGEGTWIDIWQYQTKPPKGSTGEKLGVSGASISIDMKSIVNRNGISYFNWRVNLLDLQGNKINRSKDTSSIQSKRINCSKKTAYEVKTTTWISIEDPKKVWNRALELVCKPNKSKFKLW